MISKSEQRKNCRDPRYTKGGRAIVAFHGNGNMLNGRHFCVSSGAVFSAKEEPAMTAVSGKGRRETGIPSYAIQ